MTPSDLSSKLREIAAKIDASKSPDRNLVASTMKSILNRLSSAGGLVGDDVYELAADKLVRGDLDGAFGAIKETWVDNCIKNFTAEEDADEDGKFMYYSGGASSVSQGMEFVAENELENMVDQISGWAKDILIEAGTDENLAQSTAEEIEAKINSEWNKHIKSIADRAADQWNDGSEYSKDPYKYYGVSPKDF